MVGLALTPGWIEAVADLFTAGLGDLYFGSSFLLLRRHWGLGVDDRRRGLRYPLTSLSTDERPEEHEEDDDFLEAMEATEER